MAKSSNLERADQAIDPAERKWWLSASATVTFSCPRCGQAVRAYKSKTDPFIYVCGNCGEDIDERLHLSHRRLRHLEPW